MTNELEPCPFCGGEAIVMESPDGFTSVGCANDDCVTVRMMLPLMFSFNSKEKAIKDWNTRYKRTCHQTNVGDCIKCSECGNFTTTRTVSKRSMPRFCGSCGAEVVDD